jgi:hypothetical protein
MADRVFRHIGPERINQHIYVRQNHNLKCFIRSTYSRSSISW